MSDLTRDPEYLRFVEGQRKHCRCSRNSPCDGVLAGGMCDDFQDDEDETYVTSGCIDCDDPMCGGECLDYDDTNEVR